jgi:hypothetical protein
MTDELEIKKLQTKLYLSYHNDGIIDLVIGLCAVGFSIFMATELVGLLILAWLPMLSYYTLKQALTIPRLGYVRFTSKQVSLFRYTAAALIGLLVFGIFLAVRIFGSFQTSTDFKAWMVQYHMAVYGGFLGLVAIGVAIFTGMKRFYLYGLLAFLIPLMSAWIGLPTYVPVLVLGLIITGIGFFMALRFTSTYPMPETE